MLFDAFMKNPERCASILFELVGLDCGLFGCRQKVQSNLMIFPKKRRRMVFL